MMLDLKQNIDADLSSEYGAAIRPLTPLWKALRWG